MRIQHELGADIMFAFDELTTLMNTRAYQEQSVARTQAWAVRCLAAHAELTRTRADKPYQALFGVVQGAQYEDLRRTACRDLGGKVVRLRDDGTAVILNPCGVCREVVPAIAPGIRTLVDDGGHPVWVTAADLLPMRNPVSPVPQPPFPWPSCSARS